MDLDENDPRLNNASIPEQGVKEGFTFRFETTAEEANQLKEIPCEGETTTSAAPVKITREQHEQFAKMTESYFMTGKAPTPELKAAFEAFRQWLKAIYKSIRNVGGTVSPEIAKVFDRMFAVDNRLAEIETDTAYAPAFDSAESMGLSMEEYLEYNKLVDKLRSDAQASTRERIAGQTARLAAGWRGEIQKQLTKEAEAKLAQQAPYKQIAELKLGKLKLDRAALRTRVPKLLKKIPGRRKSKMASILTLRRSSGILQRR